MVEGPPQIRDVKILIKWPTEREEPIWNMNADLPHNKTQFDFKNCAEKRPQFPQNNCGQFPINLFLAHNFAHSFFFFKAPTFLFQHLWAVFFPRPQFRPHFFFLAPTILIRLSWSEYCFEICKDLSPILHDFWLFVMKWNEMNDDILGLWFLWTFICYREYFKLNCYR